MNKKQNHGEWWNKIITDADLLELRYKLKGMFVWKPYGFQVMKNIKLKWDYLFEQENIKETYFPLLVPKEYAQQNKSWWEPFKEQAFYTNGYTEEHKNIFLRPTGEPAMYPIFKLWIRSHRDLPLRIYETVNSYRNETNTTKALVRDIEIGPWYEIHTCHETKEEAEKEIKLAIKMNEQIFNDLGVARLKVRKPPHDCFPGSIGAIEFYTILNDGLLENGSCNNLGQAYSKAFDIKFFDSNEKEQFVWQTCTGNGERFLCAVIDAHSDEKGIVLPPSIAPTIITIIIINVDEKIVEELKLNVNKKKVNTIKLKSFSEIGENRYETEKKGIPIRIEIGPKELESKKISIILRTGEKIFCDINEVSKIVDEKLIEIQKTLLKNSQKRLDERISECDNIEELKKTEIGVAGWCGSEECAGLIKDKVNKDLIGMTFEKKEKNCVWCNKKGEKAIFSKCY